jgi:hypothetical protein
LVADELAATVGEDRRASGETRAVLLAVACGESSDPTPVRNDAPADPGITGSNGLRRGECNKAAGRRKGSKRERPRNALERKIQSIASQCESGGWSSQGCDEIDLLHSEGPSVYKGAIR